MAEEQKQSSCMSCFGTICVILVVLWIASLFLGRGPSQDYRGSDPPQQAAKQVNPTMRPQDPNNNTQYTADMDALYNHLALEDAVLVWPYPEYDAICIRLKSRSELNQRSPEKLAQDLHDAFAEIRTKDGVDSPSECFVHIQDWAGNETASVGN